MSRYIIYKFEKEFEGYTKTEKPANTAARPVPHACAQCDITRAVTVFVSLIAMTQPLLRKSHWTEVCGINTDYFLHAHSCIIGA